jgi:hypothetical protein
MTARLTADDLRAKGYCPETGARVPAPTSLASRDGATAGEHALAAAPAVNVASDRGPPQRVSDDASAPRRLSTRAIAKLKPEQRLQIETVAHWRPRLVPGAKLLGLNGELPGGGKLTALRSAIRREMGYERGTPDLGAFRDGHILWLEGKVGTDQSDEQGAFADWAHSIGHGYGVFTTIEDAGVLLRIHGFVA